MVVYEHYRVLRYFEKGFLFQRQRLTDYNWETIKFFSDYNEAEKWGCELAQRISEKTRNPALIYNCGGYVIAKFLNGERL